MLSIKNLETLVGKRNQEGKKHTVEVMTVAELKEYRENCIQAIERLNRQIAKAKTGGGVQLTFIETLEQLEGYVAYIDSIQEEKKPEGMAIIDAFLEQWKERAFNYYMGVRSEYEEIRSADQEITEENLKLITDVWGNRKLSDEKISDILNKINEITPPSISRMKSDIRWAKTKSFEKGFAKHEVELIKKMFGTTEQQSQVLMNALNRDAESRKMKLIATITKKAGNILDASGLYFGPNGDINGFVIGDQKKVKVQTIYAGGHNVQILHYRVLVK